MDRGAVMGRQGPARAVAGDRRWIGRSWGAGDAVDRSWIGRSWGTEAGQGSRRGQGLDRKVVGDRAGQDSRRGQELDRGEVVGDRSRPGQSQGTRVG